MIFNAYYYSFKSTGVEEIDEILRAVAAAGKAYHNTREWTDDELDGLSVADKIQKAADKAAARWSEK